MDPKLLYISTELFPAAGLCCSGAEARGLLLKREPWISVAESGQSQVFWGYLFGCVKQRGGLGPACLLDHLIESPVLVLQQNVRFLVLLDPPCVQNLQSCTQQGVFREILYVVYFTA